MTDHAVESEFAEHGVTDTPGAQWAMLRIQDLSDKIAEYEAQAHEMVAQVNDWLDEKTGKLRQELRAEQEKLHGYLQDLIDADPDGRKSLDLPAGRVESTAGGLSFTPTDKKALVEWLKHNHPEALRPPKPGEPTPDIAAIKALVEDASLLPSGDLGEPGEHDLVDFYTGEKIPLRAVRSERSFTITTIDGHKYKNGERVDD